MRKLLLNIIRFSSPFILIVCLYFVFDPFKVVRNYDNYYCSIGGAVNRSYVSTMNYLNKKDKYHYDSFIFGNSRSLFYKIEDWEKYINNKGHCYHFSESGGSVNGIYYKLRLIDSLNGEINNALFIVDCDLLSRTVFEDGANMMTPPALTNNRNWMKFHKEHFLQWMNPRFFYYWLEYKLTGKYKPEMTEYIAFGTNYKFYNPITNEEPNHIQDSLIANGEYYDEKRIEIFNGKQHPNISERVLNDAERIKSIKEIKRILNKHNTNYKIVISPIYNQVKINPDDLQFLKFVFGEENVYDFSGVNKYTSDYHNYYEDSHYRASVASEIMDYIYNN